MPDPSKVSKVVSDAGAAVGERVRAAAASGRTWASELGLKDAVQLLEETLQEEKATDGPTARRRPTAR